jgi:uncharacterized protein (TIRG00374 family)
MHRIDVRIFSSASDAPRSRRPTDVVLLIVAVLGLLVLSVPAPGPTRIDNAVSELVKDLPGLFGWFWEICYDLLIGWALILLVIALVARRRKRLLLEELFAAALAFVFALIAGRASGTDLSESFRAISSSAPPPVYLAIRLALATAVVVMASPHLSRPLRFGGRSVLVLGALAGIALGTTLPIGIIAGLLVGAGSAAIVHLLLGSPAGRLSLEQIATALEDLEVEATDLAQAPLEPRGVALATASAPDGRQLLVKIYGRDAWDGQVLTSTWTSLSRRGESPSLGFSRIQQVEHEAFVTLLAEREGAPVLPVVAAGMATKRDALLVTEITGRSFSTLGPAEIDDALLRGMWEAIVRLHELGIAHRQIDGRRFVVRPDGSSALGGFSRAQTAAVDPPMMADRAQLLVTTALAVGPERAVAAAADAIGIGSLTTVMPLLQPAVLDRDTRRAIREREWDLDDLMQRCVEVTGSEAPQLEQLRRVTGRSILTVVLIGFLAYTLISAIAGIGISTLIDELKQADPVWLIAALLLSPFAQVWQAFSTMGASIHDVRFGPVLMLQYAIQFIALAVPSSAARVALEVRFFERNGVDAGGALSIGLIDSVSGFVVQILLILVITLSGLASLDLSTVRSSSSGSSSGGSSTPSLLAIAFVLLVLGGIVALAVPRYRTAIKEAIPRYRQNLRTQMSAGAAALRVLRSPSKLLMLFGGNLVAQVVLAIILGLCLRAFGQSASLAALILVNTFVSLFAGFMPVPGGMGVAEAGYTAGLVALGIPNAVAVSTALTFRLVTFYLPPIWGTFGMRWLRRHSYV